MTRNRIHPSEFEFRHVILCPKEACKPLKVVIENEYSYILQYADALRSSLI